VETARVLLDRAESRLAAAGVASPRVDAELLLAHVTGRPRAMLRSAGDLPADQMERFAGLIDRRARREPLQHLTGTAPFRYLELEVGPGVFVPRPETELLVDPVLAHVAAARTAAPARGPLIVDLCTGSGALALALATEVPGSSVYAVELDPDTVRWARSNLDRCAAAVADVDSSVSLLTSDARTVAEPDGPLFEFVGLVDVVVSNPPYIPDEAIPRDPEVRDHDPALALFGGPDGLDVIRRLVVQAARLLRPGGLVVVEHADVQGDDAGASGVPGVLRASPHWTDVADHRDLSGLPRFTTATRRRDRGVVIR
jgi:release factor glutamine methyltransferase